ncbi:MAG TPA: hypothetical protein VF542_10420 [Jatrophihabitans sp.]|jgi:pimeloyl-ACP methyl ester carboxylesterase
MFDGFDEWDLPVADGVSLHGRSGGDPDGGFPVVLLHGHPRTHTTWYRVAPLLVAAGIWHAWAGHVRGVVIDSGHQMAEQASEQLAAELARFLSQR